MAPVQVHRRQQKLAPKSTIFACNTGWRIKIASETWAARSSSHTYSAGATLSNATLRVAQTNSSGHKLFFTPTTAPAYVCGSNDYPIYARQVREVLVPRI